MWHLLWNQLHQQVESGLEIGRSKRAVTELLAFVYVSERLWLCLVFVLVLIFDFFVDSASCFTWSLASCLLIASSLNRDVGTVVLTTYKANANSCISSTRDLLRHVDKRSSWELRKNTHKKYIEAKGWSRRERGGWQLAPMLRCTRTPELYFLWGNVAERLWFGRRGELGGGGEVSRQKEGSLCVTLFC